ncbi:2604_t:CDS:2 [Entrophospora sp. SA101]|nr:2604_t:CDS:2 [Entrophospora sp. SA101]
MDIKYLKTLALNILRNTSPGDIANGIEVPELDSCPLCNDELFLRLIKKPFTALPCGHIFHHTCLENSIKNGIEICPARNCYKSFESELQDVEISEVRSVSSQDNMSIDGSLENYSQQKTNTLENDPSHLDTIAEDPSDDNPKDKIALIRSFSANSLSKLSQSDIDFVIVKVLKKGK